MASTETQTVPKVRLFDRLHSIPLIASSIDTLDTSLSSNTFTRSPYSTAKGLSSTAIKYTEPITKRLAPYIVVADGYANKAVDVVESRYPYPFKAKPEEVAEYVRQRRSSVSHSVDDKVHHVAQGLDQQLTPFVNAFETAVAKLTDVSTSPASSQNGSPTEAQNQYQYQRALALSKTLSVNLYERSKHLQESNVVIQRINETAHTLSALALSAHSRIHALSDSMLSDLKHLSESLSTDLKHLSADLGAIAQAPLNEKVGRIKERVAPVLEKLRMLVQGLAKKGEEVVRAHAEGNSVTEEVETSANRVEDSTKGQEEKGGENGNAE